MIACTLETVHSRTDATTLQTCYLHMHKHPYDFHYSIYGFSVADIRKHLYQYQKHAEIGEKAKLKKLNKQCIKLKSIKYRRACAVMTPNIRSMYTVHCTMYKTANTCNLVSCALFLPFCSGCHVQPLHGCL